MAPSSYCDRLHVAYLRRGSDEPRRGGPSKVTLRLVRTDPGHVTCFLDERSVSVPALRRLAWLARGYQLNLASRHETEYGRVYKAADCEVYRESVAFMSEVIDDGALLRHLQPILELMRGCEMENVGANEVYVRRVEWLHSPPPTKISNYPDPFAAVAHRYRYKDRLTEDWLSCTGYSRKYSDYRGGFRLSHWHTGWVAVELSRLGGEKHRRVVETIDKSVVSQRAWYRLGCLGRAYDLAMVGRILDHSRSSMNSERCDRFVRECAFLQSFVEDDALWEAVQPAIDLIHKCAETEMEKRRVIHLEVTRGGQLEAGPVRPWIDFIGIQ